MIKFDHNSNNKAWTNFVSGSLYGIPTNPFEIWTFYVNLRLKKYSGKFETFEYNIYDNNLFFETEEGMTLFLLEWA